MEEQDKNCISYWFPKLQASGVKVPETRILRSGFEIADLLDGKDPKGYATFLSWMKLFAREVGGFPIFLRTGHTSGKHSWERTCYVENEKDLDSHIPALVEVSVCCELPLGVWAVREFLSVGADRALGLSDPTMTAFSGNMPIRRERRVFIRDGVVEEIFPYWPKNSIRDPSNASWEEIVEELNRSTLIEIGELRELSGKVAAHFEGYWSLDWLRHRKRWYAIDMADGDRSWHPGGRGGPPSPDITNQLALLEK